MWPRNRSMTRTVTWLVLGAWLCGLGEGALTQSETHISTSRNADRAAICGYYSANYSSAQLQLSQAYIEQYSYMSEEEVETILFGNDYTQPNPETIVMVMPHLVALLVFCLILLPLCCCCVWPEKHPACRNCRKPQKEMYGKCQLKWSAYLSVLLYLVIMVGGVIGLVKGVDIVNYYNDVGCKTAAVADDTLYGRLSPSVDNRFFVGLVPLAADLTTFNSTFSTIWTQNSNSLAAADQVQSEQSVFQLFLQSIYTSYSNPTYADAFSSDGTTYTNVNSQFKTLFYGPSSSPTTVLGSIHTVSNSIFNEINAVLDPMITAYNNLSTTTETTVQAQLTATVAASSTYKAALNDFINKWAPLFNDHALLKQTVLLIKAFYGAFFALAFLGFLGAVVLACCSVVKVRLIEYFACSFLSLLAMISFVLLIILAAIAPNVSHSCAYIDVQLATGSGTEAFFTKLGAPTLGQLYSNCMSDGTGWMMDKLSPTFNTSFADLLLITQNVQNFNPSIPSYSTANLTAPFTAGNAKVTKVRDSKLLDVSSTTALNHISAVRTVAYPTDAGCDNAKVLGDSWMPSYNLYSCPGGKAQNTPCLDLSSTATCPLGCYEILNSFGSASGDSNYAINLATRYGSSACNYYNYIVKLEDNWNQPRKSSMTAVLADLTSLQSKMTDYDTTFKGTQANIGTYATILESGYNEVANLTSGSFNGLDCRVLGESIMEMRNSICVGMLNSIYFNLVCLALLSYCTLLVACCTVCAGVRHFRHLQKMQIHVGYKGVPVSISDTKLFGN